MEQTMTNSEPLQPPISADEKRTSTEKPGRRQVIVEMIKRRRTTSRSQETGHQREPAVEEIVKQAHELVDAYPQPSRLPDPVKCQVLSLGLRLHKNFGYETRYASDLEAQFERHAIANTKRTD